MAASPKKAKSKPTSGGESVELSAGSVRAIAEAVAEKLVEIGECDPDYFDIAGVLVEHVVEGEPKWQI